MKTLCGLVMILAIATGAGAATPGVCVKANGKKVQCTDFLPRPVPILTPPQPTVVPDCADGRFSDDAGEMQFGVPPFGRLYEPGRPYHLCATVPASTRPFFELKGVNHSNGVCNNYETRLVAPDGKVYPGAAARQPNQSPNYQPGTWQLVVTLSDDADSCPDPTGLSLTLSGF